MHLHAIASAFPEFAYTQQECWERIKMAPAARLLKTRSLTLLEKILTGDSGIEKRHFCIPNPPEIFLKSAQELNRDFERNAPLIAGRALSQAIDSAEIAPGEVDALFVCTCTGYLCPGITSHLAEQLGFRADAYLQDLVGLGCGAAIPTLRSASDFLAANPEATVAVVAVEISSAAFFMSDEPGVLISLCLFGDGASASIWRGEPRDGGLRHRLGNFRTVHKPEQREKIRFVNAGGKLKNQLDRAVPGLAAEAVRELYLASGRNGDIDRVLAHPGGRDVIEAIETAMPEHPLPESREVLREAGNLSSPSVLVALEKHLAGGEVGRNLWLTAFGAGFSCHSAEFARED